MAKNEINKILKTYYKVSDSSTLLFKVIANNLEILNKTFLESSIEKIEKFDWNTTLWILNNGGTGKTTVITEIIQQILKRNKLAKILAGDYVVAKRLMLSINLLAISFKASCRATAV